jgi:hypothetical protein
MRKVYKQKIKCNSLVNSQYEVKLTVPRGSKLMAVAVQNDDTCIWYTADPEEQATEKITLLSIGTGHGAVPNSIDEGKPYVYFATVIDGAFVWHLWADNNDLLQPRKLEYHDER